MNPAENNVEGDLNTAVETPPPPLELDAPTIVEILERPLENMSDAILNEVTIEDAQNFADYLTDQLNQAWNDENNRLARPPPFSEEDEELFNPAREAPAWLQHLGYECDCKLWLYINFPQVREDTIKRLFERSGPGYEAHNTLVVAMYCFIIQNNVLARPELIAFRRKLENAYHGLDDWTWDWLNKLIQYPYAGRRLKKNQQKFTEPALVRPAKEKFEDFYRATIQQFPLFFEVGKLREEKYSTVRHAKKSFPSAMVSIVKCKMGQEKMMMMKSLDIICAALVFVEKWQKKSS